ncbi:conserved hypothetical protein [Desulfosarcina cetonica]|nr:conserved hypothetical protein [Desulfosarcina cetonica]
MIRLENIRKAYHDPETGRTTVALSDVSLAVKTGEFACLLGPSGCGKSTTINLLAGFTRPTRGRVWFDGNPISDPGLDRGVVFQEPVLFSWLTVRQNVEFGLTSMGLSRGERHRLAMTALSMVGLADQEAALPHTLSGGMKQRVALARVLVVNPKVMLMDEPFSALDPPTRERLQDELLKVRGNCPVLFVTHNPLEAAYLADTIYIMAHAPLGITARIIVNLERPRDREGADLQRLVHELRGHLDQLPSAASSPIPICISKEHPYPYKTRQEAC